MSVAAMASEGGSRVFLRLEPELAVGLRQATAAADRGRGFRERALASHLTSLAESSQATLPGSVLRNGFSLEDKTLIYFKSEQRLKGKPLYHLTEDYSRVSTSLPVHAEAPAPRLERPQRRVAKPLKSPFLLPVDSGVEAAFLLLLPSIHGSEDVLPAICASVMAEAADTQAHEVTGIERPELAEAVNASSNHEL